MDKTVQEWQVSRSTEGITFVKREKPSKRFVFYGWGDGEREATALAAFLNERQSVLDAAEAEIAFLQSSLKDMNKRVTLDHTRLDEVCAERDEAQSRLSDCVKALKVLQKQALQSNVNDPANEWGMEALEMTRAVLATEDKIKNNPLFADMYRAYGGDDRCVKQRLKKFADQLDQSERWANASTSNIYRDALAHIEALEGALKPFVKEFEDRRDAYIRRYRRNPGVGAHNFDEMPDEWEMENCTFTMGDFRRARAALATVEKTDAE